MKGLRRLAWVTLGFAVLSLGAIAASHLALTDIGHGEDDLKMEWLVLRISFLVMVGFHVTALIMLARVLRADRGAGQ